MKYRKTHLILRNGSLLFIFLDHFSAWENHDYSEANLNLLEVVLISII